MASKVDSVGLYKVRRVLSELSTKHGRGTELVSLYIPPKKPIHEVIGSLRDEYGTASNIKSDTTRTHVQDALTRTMQRLRLYHKTPENGLVIFSGALPTDGPGSEVVTLHEVVPPKPVQTYLYRCDDHYLLEPIREMLKEEKIVGILSMDATEAGIGIVSGEKVEVLEVVTSGVSGKSRKGGQSARRYERLREMELNDYYHRVARHIGKAFLEDYRIMGMIVSGPGPTKDYFLKGEYLDYRLQSVVVGVVDTSYSGREGIRDTLDKGTKALEDVRLIEERKLIQKFLREVNAENGLAVYGIEPVVAALKRASVEAILVSEDLGLTYVRAVCKKDGTEKEALIIKEHYISVKQKMLNEGCQKCGNIDYDVVEKDGIEYLADASIDSGASVEVISSKTEEGAMLRSFGGIAALLRFR